MRVYVIRKLIAVFNCFKTANKQYIKTDINLVSICKYGSLLLSCMSNLKSKIDLNSIYL